MHINNYSLFFCLASLCLFFGGELKGALGYKNYTVGDDSGWFDKLEDAKVDYQSWASLKNFSLGDFLSMYFSFIWSSLLILSYFWIYVFVSVMNLNHQHQLTSEKNC